MIHPSNYKTLLKLGLPIVIGQLGMIVLGFADTLMIGHHSTEDLAGASFVNNMFNLAIIFATGFSYGLTPIVGSLFGQGKQEDVGRTLKNALLVNGLIGILLTLIMGALYLNIHRLGQPEELLPLMRPYYIVLLISLVFVMLFNAFKQFADGITDTQTPMWLLIG
ncbi:MAG: MATE family efflux transporter, partial [Bacteroides sp.]|nr:MATE family efflux transporter [Bacteroides sp.]